MKKLSAWVFSILMIWSAVVLPVRATAEATPSPYQLEVKVHPDGSVTIKTARDFYGNETWVKIMKQGDVLDPALTWDENPKPVFAFVACGEITYPGNHVFCYPETLSDFVDGKGSRLRPGKYYAVIGDEIWETDRMVYHVYSGPVEFEIPEITVTPSPEPTNAPQTPTLRPTAAGTTPAESPEEGKGSAVLWISIGAAAVVVIGIAVIIAVRKNRHR